MWHDNLKNPALVGRNSMILFLLNAEMGILRTTPPVERELGYEPAGLVGRSFSDMLHEDEQALLTQLADFDEGEELSTRQVMIWQADRKTLLPVTFRAERLDLSHTSGKRTALPEPAYLVSVCSCKESDSSYLQRGEAIPLESFPGQEGLILFESPDNRILVPTFVNQSFEALSGIRAEDIHGRSQTFLGGAGTRREVLEQARHVMSHGVALQETLLLSRNDGTTFWADVRFEPLDEMPDHRRFYMTTICDVTREKKQDAELSQARSRASEAKLAQEVFLSSMSHEIRTPMSGILGMAELLKQTGLKENQKDFLETLIRSARSLTRIMNDIQFYADLESNRVPLHIEPFRLAELVDRLEEVYRLQADETGVQFTVDVQKSLPEYLLGDMNRLEQILCRLLDNAFKFTEKGAVRLRFSLQEQTGKSIRVLAEVEDSGIGVPAELLPYLFESYSKGLEMSAKYAGIGLGLAITRKLAGLMDATVDIDSTQGEGTKVQVELPFGQADGPEVDPDCETVITESEWQSPGVKPNSGGSGSGRPETDEPFPSMAGYTILLADDHPVNRKLVDGLLARQGAAIIIAEDGREAIDKLQQHPEVDLVLMDVHMPTLSGVEATRKIRASEADGEHLPVIALTASVMTSDLELYRKSGMDDVLAKPFTRVELLSVVSRHLEESAGMRDNGIFTAGEPDADKDEWSAIRMDVLNEMVAGDKTMLLELMDLFLEQTPELIESLETAAEEREWVMIGHVAHKLKPTLRYVGMERAYQLSLKLEVYQKEQADEPDQVLQWVEELVLLVNQGVQEIREASEKLRN